MKHDSTTLKKLLRFIGAFSVLTALGTQARAALYNVDFNGGAFAPANATYSGAAVTGAAGNFWNGSNNTSGSGSQNLSVSVSGNPTVTMVMPTMGDQYADNNGNLFSSSAFVELMGGHLYLHNSKAAPIVTLGGFVPNSSFNLWIYTVGDPDVGKGGAFSVNGGAVQTNLIANVSNFINGNNFLQLTSLGPVTAPENILAIHVSLLDCSVYFESAAVTSAFCAAAAADCSAALFVSPHLSRRDL